MKNEKILPLRPIDLKSRPHNHRALAWSSDAELAVAADDCVAIYLPAFPILDPAQPYAFDEDQQQQQPPPPSAAGENGMGILPANLPVNDDEGDDDDLGSRDDEDEDEDDYDDEDRGGDEDEGLFGGGRRVDLQRQFGDETARVLWVSHPALHPELNLHVWEAAGKAMPLIRSGAGPVPGDEGGLFGDGARVVSPPPPPPPPAAVEREEQMEVEVEAQTEGEVKKEEEQQQQLSSAHEVNAHPGAGTGVIGGAGSSLNHVVAVEWSPSGLGRNLRPVLAVLTGCGSLAVYGEGGPLPFGSTAKPSRVMGRGKSAVRDLQSWLVLWAVGENFVVPGQEEFGYGEFVKAFAWCQEVGTGRALLSYMNDLREIVILCVGTTFQRTAEGLEEAVWNVQEIFRMETGGPHGQPDTCDPDYVPSGSSYCLRWSPWVKEKDTWSCLLSYMDRNYVGFKKITINAPTWSSRETPTLVCEPKDWDGRCVYLSTDAFLEFEDTIWDVNGKLICRGMIATPIVAEPFEINLSAATRPKPNHPTTKCKTTFPPKHINNPITGLIIHPIATETTAPPLTPLYTAVRLSATATSPQWSETNLPTPPPQWLTAIQTFITRRVPLGQAGHEGDVTAEGDEDGEDGIVRDPDDEGANKSDNDDDDDDDHSDADDRDPDADFDPWANEGPDVHPHRMRLWGLARSPGGGTTAILATPQLTQRPMRGTWGAHRSRVLFGWPARAAGDNENTAEDESTSATAAAVVSASAVNIAASLTTEARLWEWMYGGGPGVAGLTPRLEHDALEGGGGGRRAGRAQQARDEDAVARRARLRDLFRPFVDAQRCEVCGEDGGGGGGGGGSKLAPIDGEGGGGRVLDAVCARGHRVAVCGATGLAIMAPGISRACAVCQSRCHGAEYLLEKVLGPARVGEEVVKFVREEMGRGVCVRCGGKYLD